ncbi:hypothetical protein [Pseudoflavonifractor phocaeensis]|uniref:hypothetical protein n=1 Tax=Flintibacter porci TaxID=3342383 RepID=UPI001F1B85EF|nr:hypothetical protein [Pseudoflavonifractor phocaeensis]MCF2677360.1 hypothetical protein [Pseudoflavonifractor phocaeensis]
MGNIDITCTGKIRSKDTLVKSVQRLVKQRNLRLGVWEEGMRIVMCPRGYLDFAWTKEKGLFGQWNLRCGCNTTPVGPGFHKAALELLEELGGLGIKEWNVQDRSDYQQDRDFGALRREWFLPWLEEQVSQVLEKTAPGEMGYLFWEVDQYRPEVVPDTIATPLGRFPVAWLKEKLEKGALEELAQYLFLWDQPGMNALYLRNRALKQLWEDCCFAPSDRSYQDRQINADILDTLERSAAMDPSLPQPVADYRELCILDDRAPNMPEDAPEMEELYPIGYRRGEVLQPYDKLVVPLPGLYHYEWSNGGMDSAGAIWRDEESESPIWHFTALRSRMGSAQFGMDMAQLQDVRTKQLEGGQAHWGWKEMPPKKKDDDLLYRVSCEAVVGDTLFVITITYLHPEHREDIYDRLERMTILK